MTLSTLLLITFAAAACAYFVGYTRSQQIAKPVGGVRNLATLPSYYASMMGLWALIPALILIVLWSVLDGSIISSLVKGVLPTEAKQMSHEDIGLLMNQIENVATGVGSLDLLGVQYQPAVERLQNLTQMSKQAMPILVLLVIVIGGLLGFRAINASYNARYGVEKFFNVMLFVCSSIAIFTTFGIVFSVLW